MSSPAADRRGRGWRRPGSRDARQGASRAAGLPRSLVPCLALLAAIVACGGPRIVDEPVFESEVMRVALRKTVVDGKPLALEHDHPATISDVRLSHVLANLTYTDGEGKRVPAIRTRAVYDLSEAMNKAISQAGPDQEIVVSLVARETSNVFFTRKKATSFRAYFDPASLNIEFFDIEKELEPGPGKPGRDDEYDIPQSTPESAPGFRLMGGQGQVVEGSRLLRIDWRDPYFAKPVTLFGRGGQRRKTILMEAEEDPALAPAPEPQVEITPAIRDAQIRALDQLDALRRAGLIKESDFQIRRRLVLEGKLDEAGFGKDAENGESAGSSEE